MKIKEGYMLREVAGSFIVIPIGDAQADFTGMITLNPVGAFVWRLLEKGCSRDEIVKKVLESYNTDENTARADVDRYIEKLKSRGFVED